MAARSVDSCAFAERTTGHDDCVHGRWRSHVESHLKRALCTEELRERNELWAEIRKELISREQGELLEVYPLLESYESTRALARRHAEHANELEDAISELDALGAAAPAWKAAHPARIGSVRASGSGSSA